MYIVNKKEHHFDIRDTEQRGPCLCHGMYTNPLWPTPPITRLELFEEHDREYTLWVAAGKPINPTAVGFAHFTRMGEIFAQLVRRHK